jgi:hypothetical protein
MMFTLLSASPEGVESFLPTASNRELTAAGDKAAEMTVEFPPLESQSASMSRIPLSGKEYFLASLGVPFSAFDEQQLLLLRGDNIPLCEIEEGSVDVSKNQI